MSLQHMTGNLLESDCVALVNPVNCLGVAGAGLAKQFKDRWPKQVAEYTAFCRAGKMRPGVVHDALLPDGRRIVSVPTKRHWQDASSLDDVVLGIEGLAEYCQTAGIPSIAIPPLGCGLGGLPKLPVLHQLLTKMPVSEMEIHLYGFQSSHLGGTS